MAKRRTSGVQRRQRASADALNRRIDEPSGGALGGLPDWRLLAIGGVLVIGLIIVVAVLIVGSAPNPNAGTPQPDDGRDHVADGSVGGPYSSTPGTSGPHWDTPANWGVYDTAQPESQLIHNLEHGGIVIWYEPDAVDTGGVAEMANLVRSQVAQGRGGRFKFILSPWNGPDLESPIAVTAWRNLLRLDEASVDAIRGFADEHYGLAPEPNGGPLP